MRFCLVVFEVYLCGCYIEREREGCVCVCVWGGRGEGLRLHPFYAETVREERVRTTGWRSRAHERELFS